MMEGIEMNRTFFPQTEGGTASIRVTGNMP